MKSLFIWIFLLVVVAGAAVVVIGGGRSPESTAEAFMHALDSKNIDELIRLGHFETPPEDLREQWDHCLNVAAKNYVYVWYFERTRETVAGRAAVLVMFVVYSGPKGTELPEPIELPLIETKQGWRVNMDEMPRKFFPFLPQ